jgi:hypothetical protein
MLASAVLAAGRAKTLWCAAKKVNKAVFTGTAPQSGSGVPGFDQVMMNMYAEYTSDATNSAPPAQTNASSTWGTAAE